MVNLIVMSVVLLLWLGLQGVRLLALLLYEGAMLIWDLIQRWRERDGAAPAT